MLDLVLIIGVSGISFLNFQLAEMFLKTRFPMNNNLSMVIYGAMWYLICGINLLLSYQINILFTPTLVKQGFSNVTVGCIAMNQLYIFIKVFTFYPDFNKQLSDALGKIGFLGTTIVSLNVLANNALNLYKKTNFTLSEMTGISKVSQT